MKGTYDRALLANIKQAMPELSRLKLKVDDEWISDDGPYRFYHQSFKVFYLKEIVRDVLEMIRSLDPKPQKSFSPMFEEIVNDCMSQEFSGVSTNMNWTKETRPVVEAFFHAKFFLDKLVECGLELQEPPQMLPLKWAAVLCLYNIR